MLIELRSVSCGYRSRIILEGVTCRLDNGIHFLVGANGSGKSTLLSSVAGVASLLSGEILVDGVSIGNPAARRDFFRVSGYVPQRFMLDRSFRCEQYIEYCLWLKGLSAGKLRERVEAALSAVGLLPNAEAKIGKLSGGMQQRLYLAGQIAHDPTILILDEPSTGLDAEHRREFHRHLIALAGRVGSIVIATHSREDVMELGGTVWPLKERRLQTPLVQERGADLTAGLAGHI